MRRGLLLVLGFGLGAVMMGVFCGRVAAQLQQLYGPPPPAQTFPCALGELSVTVVSTASYDGPFLEDGSGEELTGVAAVVVENTGGTVIQKGALQLRCRERTLVFTFFALPPGSRALVLEAEGRGWEEDPVIGCSGWVCRAYPEDNGAVSAFGVSDGRLAVTNHADTQADRVAVMYKTFDPGSGMFLGGIAYEAVVEALQPGETREVLAWRYCPERSAIVGVYTENTQ